MPSIGIRSTLPRGLFEITCKYIDLLLRSLNTLLELATNNFPMDPKGLNKKAIAQKKNFLSPGRVVSSIDDLSECAPFYGWVQLGERDLYMYLNGKDDGVALRWFWLNSFESTSLSIWEKASTLFNTIIDVGAHTGCYSLVAAKINPKKSVIAIEPLPVNLSRLTINTVYNALENIIVIPGAAFSANQSLEINSFNKYGYCSSGNSVIEASSPTSTSLVRGFCLNDLFEKHSGAALIKVDTEGEEHHVISGAANFLESRSWFICESTKQKTADILEGYFLKQNYTFFVIDDEANKIAETNTLSPLSSNGRLVMNRLNRLVIPREDIGKLHQILS